MSKGTATAVEHGMVARVTSISMDKTVGVVVERRVKHPVYGKYLNRRTKLLAHDEANECQVGDVVLIVSSRPLSKCKSWRVSSVIERTGEVVAGIPEGAEK